MKILSLLCRSELFRERLEESRSRLYRVAYSWSHDAALADDLVQETLAKALNNAAQLREPEMMRSWLFSILSNCWRDHFRGLRDMDDINEIEDFRCAVELTPEDVHSKNQVVAKVRNAVIGLPLGQRQVVTLVDLEEFSYAEVAAILDIPVGTVMSRLCRARQALKQSLLDLSPVRQAQVTPIRRIK